MKRKQIAALLLSAVLAVVSAVPAPAVAAAAENTGADMTAEAAVPEEETEEDLLVPTPEEPEVSKDEEQAPEELEGSRDEEQAPEEAEESSGGETAETEEQVPEEQDGEEPAAQQEITAEEASVENAAVGETLSDEMAAEEEPEIVITENAAKDISEDTVLEETVEEAAEAVTGVAAGAASETDNNFKAYLEGYPDRIRNIYIYLHPGQEKQLRVLVNADDYSGMSYTWKKDDEVIREITAEELNQQNIDASSDTLTVYGDENAYYKVVVNDGLGNETTISFEIRIENELWAYPDGNRKGSDGRAPTDTTIYANPGEEVTLKVCVNALDHEGITYKWYDNSDNTMEGEEQDSIKITAAGNESYQCKVTDRYGNSKYAYFYIRNKETFTAYPEGAEPDDYGRRETEITKSVSKDEETVLTVVAEAEEGIELSYEWAGSLDWTIDDAEDVYSKESITICPSESGYYSCTVSDQYGNSKEIEFDVNVNHFEAYPINGKINSDGSYSGIGQIYAVSGETVKLEVNVSGDDITDVSYVWSNDEGTLDEEGSSLEITATESCNYYCRVYDGYCNYKDITFYITVDYFAIYPENPVIKGDGNKSDSKTLYAEKGETLNLRALIETENQDGLHYTWYTYALVNGYSKRVEVEDPIQTDNETGSTLTVTAQETNSYHCNVTRDGSDDWDCAYFTVYVAGDSTPTVTSDAPESNVDYIGIYTTAPGEEVTLHVIVTDSGAASDPKCTITWMNAYMSVIAQDTDTYTFTAESNTGFICKVRNVNGKEEWVNFFVRVDHGFTALPAGITESNYDSENNLLQITSEPSEEITLDVEASVNDGSELHYLWQKRAFDESGDMTTGWQYFDNDSAQLQDSPDVDTRYECVVSDSLGQSKTVIFDVLVSDKKDVGRAIIKLAQTKVVYTETPIEPEVTVIYKGVTLTKDVDYTLTYSYNTYAPSTANILVQGKGEYTGKVVVCFKIVKAEQDVKVSVPDITVDTTEKITVTGNKGYLYYDIISGRDIVSLSQDGTLKGLKEGTAQVLVGCSEATGYNRVELAVTVNVKVAAVTPVTPAAKPLPAAPSNFKAANMKKGIKLTWTKVTGATGYVIKRGGKVIKTINSGTKLSFIDRAANKNGTTYKYRIYARSAAGTGTKYKAVNIYRLARPAFTSVRNNASKVLTLKWKKNTAATGYQICCSRWKSFAHAKWVTISKKASVKKVLKKLKKGGIYYVRIRTYKKVGKKKYYSLWSATKKIKIKK